MPLLQSRAAPEIWLMIAFSLEASAEAGSRHYGWHGRSRRRDKPEYAGDSSQASGLFLFFFFDTAYVAKARFRRRSHACFAEFNALNLIFSCRPAAAVKYCRASKPLMSVTIWEIGSRVYYSLAAAGTASGFILSKKSAGWLLVFASSFSSKRRRLPPATAAKECRLRCEF